MSLEHNGVIYQQGFDRDTWETPQWLFDWLNSIYTFDIDICANPHNAKCKSYFSESDSALEKENWSAYGNNGFCNPPYSKPSIWVNQCAEQSHHQFNSVMLIPTPNGEKYYRRVFDEASSITIIEGRLAFVAPCNFYIKNKQGKTYYFQKGQDVSGNTRGSCVVDFAPVARRAGPRIYYESRDLLIEKYSAKPNCLSAA